jgi:hypothetical protein
VKETKTNKKLAKIDIFLKYFYENYTGTGERNKKENLH